MTQKNKGAVTVGQVGLIILAMAIVAGGAYYVGRTSPIKEEVKNQEVVQDQNKDVKEVENKKVETVDVINNKLTNLDDSTKDWKIYINSKYGFSFKYPNTWSQTGKESESICDLKTGDTCVWEINFMDDASKGIELYDGNNNELAVPKNLLSLKYYFNSNGTTLYNYALSEYGSQPEIYKYRKLEVAGTTAIVTDSVSKISGKGKPIIPAHITNVIFMDKNKVGAFGFIFRTPEAGSDKEIVNFEQVLKTFRFN